MAYLIHFFVLSLSAAILNGEHSEKDASGKKGKWVDPTHEELSGYRQAEQLFKSSLLQLQITELRGEVSVEYLKLSGLEEVLRSCALSPRIG